MRNLICITAVFLGACTSDAVQPRLGLEPEWTGLSSTVVLPDAGLSDASHPSVEVVDSGSANAMCDCVQSDPCRVAFCENDVCVERWAPHGTDCSDGVPAACVDGACVVRTGCGDGYREPGPLPAREACDDGNTDNEDACDTRCEPTPFVIASDVQSDADPGTLSLAVDDAGRALAAWVSTGTEAAVRVRALSRSGVQGALLDLDTSIFPGWDPQLVVGGRRDGWVAAWRTEVGVQWCSISPVGERGAIQSAGGEGSSTPRLVRAGGETWLLYSQGEAGSAAVEYWVQRINTTGAVHGEPIFVLRGAFSDPQIACEERCLLVVHELGSGAIQALPLEFDGSPAGAVTQAVDVGGRAALAALSDGRFALAYVDRTADPRGDVRLVYLDVSADLEVSEPVALAERGEHVEAEPTLTEVAAGSLLVGYVAGERRAHVARLLLNGSPSADLAWLESEMASSSSVGAIRVTRGVDGVWITWRGDGLGHPDAWRSFGGALLPPL